VAQEAGTRIVAVVLEDLRPHSIMGRLAFENAIRANAAIGGSTNAIIHLMALAGRLGVRLSLDDFDELSRPVPTLVDLLPSGRYLMEDFCYAGGLPVVLRELAEAGLLNADQVTVTGKSIGDNVSEAVCWNRDVIRSVSAPLMGAGTGTAVLHGNLCPNGAVIKQSAASVQLMQHRGRALVFDSPEAYYAVCDTDDFDVEDDDVIVVRYAGPKGYPGMPEVANVALPTNLLKRGVTDMVRICDGRMSGTSFGTVVLHVAPEAAVGGPLSLVESGDFIELDVPARSLRLDVPDEVLELRRASWSPARSGPESGYTWLYIEHVLQADEGADFDFLRGARGHEVPRDSH
jgi:dihydroxy-acid dehydratase